MKLWTKLVGLFFLAGCASKLMTPYTSMAELPIPYLQSVQLVGLLSLELYLGIMLIFRPYKLTVDASLAVLSVFCIWLIVLWTRHSASCGCFDGLGWKRSPQLALCTNVGLMAGLIYFRRKLLSGFSPKRLYIALACVVATGVLFTLQLQHFSPKHESTLAQFEGQRSVLLKVSPSCEHCELYTVQILQKYPNTTVAAVTYVPDPVAISNYMATFKIPLKLISVEDFAKIDGKVDVPHGYKYEDGKFKEIEFK